MEFNLDQISKLRDLISPEDDDQDSSQLPEQYQGSMLNPGNIGASQNEKKQVAKPFAKVEAKVFGKEPEKPKKEKQVDNKKEIWQKNEIKEIPISKNETRPRPEFEITFKQKVGTEDIFLGINEMDPTSTKCQELLLRVFMQDTQLKEIQVDLTEQAACIQAPKYYLYHVLPYKIKDKEAKAKWISDKYQLEITMPIIREDPF